ncbi:precorrin-6y C5,15-methyltransferase (decarboxylating) subunit CbiE [Georhizobium profundi]|uniref:Precorrin-6y C5,15-methyltransferase (Decarboxylating) subunit CbiE n=1 Tax=Georhizobium profundi TaxID=2341112 RepID=A0A3Q8XN70_9HYPH|nr:precorrin-6y C5,15-methyltransferase (decarboxylating) subunit CbiE [Georhizobium profundi]AZN71414.1 precorrin-6y C5,15-methyltransferase (decarboxylating) subunit CbiE [Georhizobium profundi]
MSAADGKPADRTTPWLTIIGIGEEGVAGLSSRALAAIAGAEAILGARRVLDALSGVDLTGKTVLDWSAGFEPTMVAILARRGSPLVILATGDPMHFGIGSTLARHIPPAEMAIVGVSSAFSLAAARLGWPLQDVACISLHGRPVARLAAHLADGQRILALTSDGQTVHEAAALLTRAGYGASRLTVLEHLGGPKERIVHLNASGADGYRFADFNTLAITCIADADVVIDGAMSGLPDDAFEHDGQMTKREIRAAVLAHLRPGGSRLLWDVGAGCGSIAVEWLRAAPLARAIAIEPVERRLAMIRSNAETFGVPHLTIVEGRAPDGLAGLDKPDAIFIGGGISTEGTFETAWAALQDNGRLVASAVTLESEARLLDLHARFGGNLVRMAVSRAEPVGRFMGWKPLMPVTLWSVTKATDGSGGGQR